MTTPSDLAWAAGFFEGEGTIRINKATRRNMGNLVVSVVNCDFEPVQFFQDRWPAYLKRARAANPTTCRPAWTWVASSRVAAEFLRSIRPYVVRPLVLQRIDHALDFQAQKTCGRVNRTPEYREQQWSAYVWMCELNRRGPGAGEIPRAMREHRAEGPC